MLHRRLVVGAYSVREGPMLPSVPDVFAPAAANEMEAGALFLGEDGVVRWFSQVQQQAMAGHGVYSAAMGGFMVLSGP